MISYVLIIIILLFLLASCIRNKNKNKINEGFYDLVPYKYDWNMFKCYSEKCLDDRLNKCLEYCPKIDEPGGRLKCYRRCKQYARMQNESLRLNDYTFGPRLPCLRKYSILNDWNQENMVL